jgi:integrase
MKNCPLGKFTSAAVKMLMDRKAKENLPGAANNRRKWLSAMCGWAIEEGIWPAFTVNPARDAKKKKYASDGYYTWTVADIRKFEERWPLGTKPRLAMSLLLFAGMRKSDMVRLGPQHVVNGWIRYVPRKTRHVNPNASEKPLLPVLTAVIEASPCGTDAFLIAEKTGEPYTANGFGNAMREWCDAAGLPECTSHGLKKAAAVLAAENGATEYQMMALFDWLSPAMAQTYIRKANRKKFAAQAMPLITLDGLKEAAE